MEDVFFPKRETTASSEKKILILLLAWHIDLACKIHGQQSTDGKCAYFCCLLYVLNATTYFYFKKKYNMGRREADSTPFLSSSLYTLYDHSACIESYIHNIQFWMGTIDHLCGVWQEEQQPLFDIFTTKSVYFPLELSVVVIRVIFFSLYSTHQLCFSNYFCFLALQLLS